MRYYTLEVNGIDPPKQAEYPTAAERDKAADDDFKADPGDVVVVLRLNVDEAGALVMTAQQRYNP